MKSKRGSFESLGKGLSNGDILEFVGRAVRKESLNDICESNKNAVERTCYHIRMRKIGSSQDLYKQVKNQVKRVKCKNRACIV